MPKKEVVDAVMKQRLLESRMKLLKETKEFKTLF